MQVAPQRIAASDQDSLAIQEEGSSKYGAAPSPYGIERHGLRTLSGKSARERDSMAVLSKNPIDAVVKIGWKYLDD